LADRPPAARGCALYPIHSSTRDQPVDRSVRLPRYAPVDALFAMPKDAAMEIVVDWQLPSDTENRRG
jgi:hypothetical protein